MADTPYRIKVENIFEGPMDLLIHLIRKHEVDIYDIPIALITQQYLAYVELIQLTEVDNAGDFILMAATLTQIKSRTLLPTHGHEDEEEDPRLEIARPLLEYIKLKHAAEALAQRSLLGADTFIRPLNKEEMPPPVDDELMRIGLFELIDAFQLVLTRLPGQHKVDLSTEGISVKERISQLVDKFENQGSMTFDELFDRSLPGKKSDIIITFLAVLEMVKLNLIHLVQHVQSGIIRLFYL